MLRLRFRVKETLTVLNDEFSKYTEDLLVVRNEIVSIVSPNIDLKIDLCSPCVT